MTIGATTLRRLVGNNNRFREVVLENQGLWSSVMSELEVSLSKANFGTWLRDTFIIDDTGETITIGVPNTFYLDWIRNKYHKNIAEALRKFRPAIRDISYTVASKAPAPPVALSPVSTQIAQTPPNYSEPIVLPESGGAESLSNSGRQQAVFADTPVAVPEGHAPLDETRLFTNFVVGSSNRLAHAVSLAAAEEPGKKYNPLFLYGGVGLGKTHLAQAIGNEVRKNNPKFRITYISCETFTNDFIESIRKNQMDSFKDRYRKTDVFLIDDVQFMSGKEQTQEEFFHTFNALHQAKKQIVLTADREPQNIPELESRLTSRFAWGMVADIQPPDFETRVAILRAKCAEGNYIIPDESIEAIAKVIQSNIRELEGALQRVITQSAIEKIPLTPEYVAQVFSHVAIATSRSRQVSTHKIIQIVSDFFSLESSEVVGTRRYKELVYPRQIIMYLLRHELSYSYPKIGKEIGGKDHTTVMHGVDKIEKEIARNATIQDDLSRLKEKLYQSM